MSKRHAPIHLRLLAATALLAAAAAACVGNAPISTSSDAPTATPPVNSAPSPTPGQSSVLVATGPISPVQTASSSQPAATPKSLSGPTSAPLSSASLSEADNGKSIRVTAGASVELVLHNIYWHIAGSSAASILKPIGAPVYSGAGTLKCIPGTGCGTITATFQAVATGTAQISATRTTCGEALQCIGDQKSFAVTLIVVP